MCIFLEGENMKQKRKSNSSTRAFKNSKSHTLKPSFKPAPLNTSLFVSSIIGIIVSTFYIWRITIPWAAAFIAVFAIMFIASMISMTSGEMRE